MPIIEDKLKELRLVLPAAPVAGGSYLPHRINGNTLILAGVISVRDGVMTHVGQVGAGVQTVDTGREAVFAMLACEAEIAGRLVADTAKSELAGVPFVVKDLFDAAGWPTKAGSTFLEEERARPEGDGALVARLRAEGAVLAGKTQLHEFAYGITGENPHYGDVEHPRLPGRTSGGSSSGSAAAVAAGVVPLAFGTDTAGSIRVPAAFCGLF